MLLQGGHNRLCQFRNCDCDKCRSYDGARNKLNDLRAYLQNFEGNVEYEMDLKLEVKEEPND